MKQTPRFTTEEFIIRFWAKVDKCGPIHPFTPSLGKCWLWNGKRNNLGYGKTRRNGKEQFAHRHAWELTNGPIPIGKFILHSCGNPPCVNPSHTYSGNAAQNAKDTASHGRKLIGERNPQAKITEELALEIRNNYPLKKKPGAGTLAEKAATKAFLKKYNVTRITAWYIATGRSWKHLV